ncbi:MAG TPA: NAD(P)-dependent oxidoreductase [Rhodobacteraceae bacterium]|nr:NAD(P)-dependent oxidoreductase [Paracoccaceae bacterium]
MSNITFLGLGAMGSRMAQNLITAGHDVCVWNRTPERCTPLVDAGARTAPTPSKAVDGAEIVISMLTNDEASREVWFGKNGALTGLDPAALTVESSTVSPTYIAELNQALCTRGIAFLDAPVAGSRPQAEAGELVFLVGGAAQDVARFEPVALAMGKAVLHAGKSGQGSVLKMIVNALLAVQTVAIGELLTYADVQGLDPKTALSLLAPTPVMSPAAQMSGAMIVQGQHAPMFPINLLLKDLGYLLAGRNDLTVMSAVQDAFKRAKSAGLGDMHITAVANI